MNRQLGMVDKYIKSITQLDTIIDSLRPDGFASEIALRRKLVELRKDFHDSMLQNIKNSKNYEGLVDQEH